MSLGFRFLCYGAFGVACEILFTAAKRGSAQEWRDLWRRTLWMFPIYGLAVFVVEPIHAATRDCSWVFRGVVYTAALFTSEFISGAVIRAITGRCPWDYTGQRFHFMGLINWSYAPLWFGYCLVLEQVHNVLTQMPIS